MEQVSFLWYSVHWMDGGGTSREYLRRNLEDQQGVTNGIMTAEEFRQVRKIVNERSQELREKIQRGEITWEQYNEILKDEIGCWIECMYSPEEIAEAEAKEIEEDKKKRQEMLREEYGAGTALNAMSERDRSIVKDRLCGIPAELEMIFYLHDIGKVLFEGTTDYHKAVNYYDGIDVSFMDQEEAQPGYTNLAGGDVKNTKVDHPNFFIETNTKRKGQWLGYDYSWGKHVLEEKRNRLILYVRGGDFGQAELINDELSERENARRIIEHYYNNPDKLNHPIEIISAEDVRRFLSKHQEIKERCIKEYCKGYTIPKDKWIEDKYPALRIERKNNKWTEIQLTADNPFILRTKPYTTKADIESIETKMRADQAKGLSLSLLYRLLGQPNHIMTEEEITAQVEEEYGQNDY